MFFYPINSSPGFRMAGSFLFFRLQLKCHLLIHALIHLTNIDGALGIFCPFLTVEDTTYMFVWVLQEADTQVELDM